MHFAILLRGEIRRDKPHHKDFYTEFSYDKTYYSFFENVLTPILEEKHQYTLFASIKSIQPEKDNQNFIKLYQLDENNIRFNSLEQSQFMDFYQGLKIIQQNQFKTQFDFILVLRIDLIYKCPIFPDWNLNLDKINFTWREPIINYVCDLIHGIPIKYLDHILTEIEKPKEMKKLEERFYGQCLFPQLIHRIFPSTIIYYQFPKYTYYSGTFWNKSLCNNPIYIIYGYKYYFDRIYD